VYTGTAQHSAHLEIRSQKFYIVIEAYTGRILRIYISIYFWLYVSPFAVSWLELCIDVTCFLLSLKCYTEVRIITVQVCIRFWKCSIICRVLNLKWHTCTFWTIGVSFTTLLFDLSLRLFEINPPIFTKEGSETIQN
jgi:hypothetical protein